MKKEQRAESREQKRVKAGFTIPELLIAISMTGLFVMIITLFAFNYWRYSYRLQSDLSTFVARLSAGDFFREAIGGSSGLITQNSLADTHVNNADPLNANHWVPIHAIPGTTATPASGLTTPLLYFRRFSVNSAGAFIMNGTQPYEDEFVLYLDGTTRSLLLRSLANPAASGNRLKTSCPAAQATAACPADKVVIDNLASVATRFFSRSGNTIDYTSIVDPTTGQYIGPDFPVAEVVEFTLNVTAKVALTSGTGTSNSTIIRIALRNS